MIDQLFESRATLENPTVSLSDPDAIGELFGSTLSATGEPVTKRTALALSAFWCAVKMISGDTSQLPLAVVDYPDANVAMPLAIVDHELRRFIRPAAFTTPDQPDLTFLQLMRRVMVHALIYENGYIWADFDNAGNLRGLYQLLSDRTAVTMHRGRRYVVTEVSDDQAADGFRLVARPYEEVLHIEGLCVDNLSGLDTVEAARDDLAVALSAIGFKAKFFKNRMTAGGILQAPEGSTPEATKKIEKAIEQLSGGDEAFRTLVLRDGYRWHQTQVKPAEAQLTELEESAIRDVARRFLMQPARLGVRESISYNSLESEKRDYHGTTLSYWLSSIASQMTAKLLSEAEKNAGREVAFNANLRLVWADAATLATIASQGTTAGWLDEDEARAWFMLPPRPAGSETNDDEDETNDDQTDQTDQTGDDAPRAFRALLAAELRRHAGRAAVQAAKYARRGNLAEYIDGASDSKDAAIAAEGLAPVLTACRAAGFTPPAAVHLAADIVSQASQLELSEPDRPELQQLADRLAAAAFETE